VLYIVLILVLAALGLLVTALITANSLWAWVSIGLSVVAGVILIADFLRRRSKPRAGDAAEAEAGEDDEIESTQDGTETADTTDTAESEAAKSSDEADQPAERTEVLPAAGASQEEPGDSADDDSEPAEEETDAADLLVVSELDVQVVVVDERPRYHLTSCRWLGDRETIPIAVAEARDLGFTPCARCRPDAKLAADHRAKRTSPAE
jgi:hypothetical protein